MVLDNTKPIGDRSDTLKSAKKRHVPSKSFPLFDAVVSCMGAPPKLQTEKN